MERRYPIKRGTLEIESPYGDSLERQDNVLIATSLNQIGQRHNRECTLHEDC